MGNCFLGHFKWWFTFDDLRYDPRYANLVPHGPPAMTLERGDWSTLSVISV
ncbi:MAG TPA: hypothetical protein VJ124_12730 [Pyrinomonadaceae bacterium]|nr:hypothetical protein [Pyrinomonadaceae bacterium]